MTKNTVGERLDAVEEVVAILVSELGAAYVSERLQAARLERTKDNIKHRLNELAQAITDGKMREVELVGAGTTVSAVEHGGPYKMLYIETPFSNLVQSVQEKLLGKPKGTRITTENSSTVEVIGVYENVAS